MKKSRSPVSPNEFIINLRMILSSDAHKNNVGAIKNTIAPPPPPPAVAAAAAPIAVPIAGPAPPVHVPAPPLPKATTVLDYPPQVQTFISTLSPPLQAKINTFLSYTANPKTQKELSDDTTI